MASWWRDAWVAVAETVRRGRPREWMRIWSGGGGGQGAARSIRVPASRLEDQRPAGRSPPPRVGAPGVTGCYFILEILNFKTLPLGFEKHF